MKSLKTYIGAIAIAITTLIGVQSASAYSYITNNETIFLSSNTVTGPGCPGGYTGQARMTNNTVGNVYYPGPWVVAPTNAIQGLFGIQNDFTPSSKASVKSRAGRNWCDTNSVVFTVYTNDVGYALTLYTEKTLTNNTPIPLTVIWVINP